MPLPRLLRRRCILLALRQPLPLLRCSCLPLPLRQPLVLPLQPHLPPCVPLRQPLQPRLRPCAAPRLLRRRCLSLRQLLPQPLLLLRLQQLVAQPLLRLVPPLPAGSVCGHGGLHATAYTGSSISVSDTAPNTFALGT